MPMFLPIPPLPGVLTLVRPHLLTVTMALVELELPNVLGAGVRVVQGALSTPLVNLELSLVVRVCVV
eukprot:CAMPEP_0168382682 /NCGR_PEP_ID=MMETSP0228-20121227/13519_1 /TAXON_ID=133427 /ORGANISM="Protoceratium reticulatum, Strain CCCM 535 (=CCMP 1889)" /LENGTH=66 /DNA_ID=CAMNT_0008395821 /DNA_START=1093 /DNA_END=1293 /DNA_ORIENTATION=+